MVFQTKTQDGWYDAAVVLLVINITMNLLTLWAVFKGVVCILNLFLLVEGVSVVYFLFKAFSPLSVMRFIMLLLGAQVRTRMVMVSSLLSSLLSSVKHSFSHIYVVCMIYMYSTHPAFSREQKPSYRLKALYSHITSHSRHLSEQKKKIITRFVHNMFFKIAHVHVLNHHHIVQSYT